jgi:hypothetical protein
MILIKFFSFGIFKDLENKRFYATDNLYRGHA